MSSMLGMPVQVFPQGPPAPPPAPKPNQLNVNNGNRSPSVTRKSPQPQSFEPPPFGFRPEIKIPSNPMANLRKVPQPKPKEANWCEEFRKERSVSPMPPSVAQEATDHLSQETKFPEPAREFNVQQSNTPTFDKVDSPINTVQSPFIGRQSSLKDSENTDQNNNFSSFGNAFNPNSPTQRVYSPFASSPQPNLPKPLSPVKLNQTNQEENVPIYVRSSQRATSPKPPTPSQFEQTQSPVSTFQKQSSLDQAQTPGYTRSTRNVSASPVKQLNQPSTNETENYPIYVRSFQKQQAPAPPTTPVQMQTPQQPLSTAQRFINEPGRQYQQPNRTPIAQNNQQMPPWMRRSNSKDLPEWANPNDEFNRTTVPQPNQQTSTFTPNSNYATNNSTAQYGNNNSTATNGAKVSFFNHFSFNFHYFMTVFAFRSALFQFNLNNLQQKRQARLVSQLNRTKTHHHNTIACSHHHLLQLVRIFIRISNNENKSNLGEILFPASNYASTYNDPHKFVDQGYNDVQNWDVGQRVMSPTMTSNDGSRVIPIKLEDGHPYLNGPVSQTPHVIQRYITIIF